MVKEELSAIFANLSNDDNIVGVGYGHKQTRGKQTEQEAIIVLVRKKHTRNDLAECKLIPRKINGQVTDIIEVGDVRLFNDRTQLIRPIQPGISIGHYKVSAGTFGAVVKDRTTGEVLLLSNNHVFANSSNAQDGRAQSGDMIYQPGKFDGNLGNEALIAYLERFIPIHREVAKSNCPIAKLFEKILNNCVKIVRPNYVIEVHRRNDKINVVDCAVARPVDVAQVNPEILEIGPIAGIKQAQVGMSIKKSGRSTGLTHSIVLATDVSIKVDMGNNEYALFSEQVLAGAMSMPGDSGSLVLTEDNYAVGLLFAGSDQVTMFNRIDNVLDALNVTI